MPGCMSFHWKHQENNISKTPFSLLIATQREMHKSIKAQRKNLVQAIYQTDTPKLPTLTWPFGHAVDTN